jgi:hypothetical protein
LNHDEDIKEIEKGRDYLLEAWFSQEDSNPLVTTNRDNLSEKKKMVSVYLDKRAES